MAPARGRSVALLLAALALVPGCSSAEGEGAMGRLSSVRTTPPVTSAEASSPTVEAPASSPTVEAAAPSTTVEAPAASTSSTTAVAVAVAPAPKLPVVPVAPPPPPPPRPVLPRVVVEQPWTPLATVGGLTLVHPSSRVERVGFHQSNHDGARQLEPLPTAVASTTLETRDRLTGSRTAADVVIDPAIEVRSPVTGTVKRAGTYVLYCDYSDDYAVIQPDGQPGWEVKILHINGVHVAPGDRVIAGQTVIAGGPTPLPFESQVDELSTAETAWPHVHIEVIDLAIPDVPSPGGGCN